MTQPNPYNRFNNSQPYSGSCDSYAEEKIANWEFNWGSLKGMTETEKAFNNCECERGEEWNDVDWQSLAYQGTEFDFDDYSDTAFVTKELGVLHFSKSAKCWVEDKLSEETLENFRVNQSQ